jgi:hypothetical protein
VGLADDGPKHFYSEWFCACGFISPCDTPARTHAIAIGIIILLRFKITTTTTTINFIMSPPAQPTGLIIQLPASWTVCFSLLK